FHSPGCHAGERVDTDDHLATARQLQIADVRIVGVKVSTSSPVIVVVGQTSIVGVEHFQRRINRPARFKTASSHADDLVHTSHVNQINRTASGQLNFYGCIG